MSALWDPIFGRTATAACTDDRAWLVALCDVESALAAACVMAGLLDAPAAARIAEACRQVATTEPADIGAQAAVDGNPVIPTVAAIRAAAGPPAAGGVHLGATSQDILDTASMLIVHRTVPVLLESLDRAERATCALAHKYRDTAMAGRTLLQQAVPTTFGAVTAGWGEGLIRAAAGLQEVGRRLPVQLGGAAGTMAGWHPHGRAVRASFAVELGLTDPGTVWHTERTRVGEVAVALGTASGVIGKIATDIVLLAQTEIGEIREIAAGRSSTMLHKQNPIAAVTARAGAAQAPGLVATMLSAMPAELQRGAGTWHAEWPALTALLNATGGSADRLATSLSGLQVNAEAMARNLADLHGQGVALDVGHAPDLVDHYLAGRTR